MMRAQLARALRLIQYLITRGMLTDGDVLIFGPDPVGFLQVQQDEDVAILDPDDQPCGPFCGHNGGAAMPPAAWWSIGPPIWTAPPPPPTTQSEPGGQGLLEYALIVVGVAVLLIALVAIFGDGLAAIWRNAVETLAQAFEG